MQNVFSFTDFRQKMEGHDHVALLIHNPDNETSRCAFRKISEAMYLNQTIAVFIADVSQCKDANKNFGVKTEPTLLLFEKGERVNELQGCHESDFFRSLINNDLN
jgi:hypothetical protein